MSNDKHDSEKPIEELKSLPTLPGPTVEQAEQYMNNILGVPKEMLNQGEEPDKQLKESDDRIVAATNCILFLSRIIHGIECGERGDLIENDYKDLNYHYHRLLHETNLDKP